MDTTKLQKEIHIMIVLSSYSVRKELFFYIGISGVKKNMWSTFEIFIDFNRKLYNVFFISIDPSNTDFPFKKGKK
jgi:hypothetical protein